MPCVYVYMQRVYSAASQAGRQAGGWGSLPLRSASARRCMHLRKNGLFFEFSLCLSRACLGKMIVFIYKWLKTTVFTHRDQDRAQRHADLNLPIAAVTHVTHAAAATAAAPAPAGMGDDKNESKLRGGRLIFVCVVLFCFVSCVAVLPATSRAVCAAATSSSIPSP
jgi:hypothetical protein